MTELVFVVLPLTTLFGWVPVYIVRAVLAKGE